MENTRVTSSEDREYGRPSMKSLGLAAKQKFLLISTTSSSTEFSTGAELRRFLIFSIKREMPVLISLPMFILMRLGQQHYDIVSGEKFYRY